MKKYFKELIILFVQLFMFYIFPLFMYLYEPIGTVMMILLVTFVLSIVLNIISKNRIKYLYPFVISILFIPSIYMYYNDSALIHSIWYLVISLFGMLIGSVIKLLKKECK